MAFRLDGKTALVTGGGRGIGAAIVTRLAEAGAAVVTANRTLDYAADLAQTLRARDLKVEAVALPSMARTALTELIDHIAAAKGVDIVIHNAGGCVWTSLDDLSEERLVETLDLNLSACFWLTQAAARHMRSKRSGRILITSSVTGNRAAMAGASHYAAAKAGVNGFIRAAALELAADGITVNGVEPGFIAKPGRGRLGTPEAIDKIGGFVPMGHMGEPDDIAYAMMYLASDEARYVTGQTIVVDGGALLPETGYALESMKAAQ
jgi:3-oxoacyl-[acyl-carrier protein] reductase